jgi:hypothetical protein
MLGFVLLLQFAFYDSARVNSSGIDFQVEQLPIGPTKNVRLLSFENFHHLGNTAYLIIEKHSLVVTLTHDIPLQNTALSGQFTRH